MITVEVSGGLGNQMYKFAFGYAMAKKYNQPLCIDTSILDYVDFRKFGLDGLSLSYEKRISYRRGTSLWDRLLRPIREKKALGKVTSVKQGKDPYFYSDVFEKRIGKEGNYYLYGGWANFRYFDGERENIRKIFQPREIDAEIECLSKRFREEESVAVHVRRGDYMKLGIALPAEYYKEALRQLKERFPDKLLKFYVFSDDPEHCKEAFASFDETEFTFLQYKNEKKSIYDMYLMSQCKYLVTANSTYSWWAAYLARDDAHVIAPVLGIWKEDLYPKEWKTIRLQ